MKEIKRDRVLLGVTNENTIAFCDFELRNPTFYNRDKGNYTEKDIVTFSACFETVGPIDASVDLEEYFERWKEDFGKDYLYDQCEHFDCAPSELAKCLADECDDVRDAYDCSLYPELIETEKGDFAFESDACGQHDLKEVGWKILIDREFFEKLYKLWKKYHLKSSNDADSEMVKEAMELANSGYVERYADDDEIRFWIQGYIESDAFEAYH